MPASFPPPYFHVVGPTRDGLPVGKSTFYCFIFRSLTLPTESLSHPDAPHSQSQPPSSEAPHPKTSHAKQDNAPSRAKAPSTGGPKAKGKGNPATMMDGDDNVATQPVSKSHSVP